MRHLLIVGFMLTPLFAFTTRNQHGPAKVIHVIVALCDNQYQGIVPVPPQLGNGDDPANNLYWGARYGVKTFLKSSKDWTLIADVQNPKSAVLERAIFQHRDKEVFLVADAYRGREIKQSIRDFLTFAAGRSEETVDVNDSNTAVIAVGGRAHLLVYVGHDGLMDFGLDTYPQKSDDRRRDAIILACLSKQYFEGPLRRTGVQPVLWTTGLMAPESYVLKAAIDGWILHENGETIRRRAAQAYHAYQKCGLKAALRLFAHGW